MRIIMLLVFGVPCALLALLCVIFLFYSLFELIICFLKIIVIGFCLLDCDCCWWIRKHN